MPHCNWREVTPVSIAGAVVLPFGRIGAGLGRSAVAALVHRGAGAGRAGDAGRRLALSRQPTLAASLGVGALAGFGGGAVQIGAPPLLVFWLGGNNDAVTVRANIMVYFVMQGALSMVMYFFSGLFSAQAIVAVAAARRAVRGRDGSGALWFHGASDDALPPRRLSDHRAWRRW